MAEYKWITEVSSSYLNRSYITQFITVIGPSCSLFIPLFTPVPAGFQPSTVGNILCKGLLWVV